MVAITTGKEYFMPDGESLGANLAASQGVTVTAAGGAHTKGAWTQLIAATSRLGKGIIITFSSNVASRAFLVDIGIGGAGSETVLIPNIFHQVGGAQPGQATRPVFFNIRIPAGSRISARCQCSTGANVILVSAQVME